MKTKLHSSLSLFFISTFVLSPISWAAEWRKVPNGSMEVDITSKKKMPNGYFRVWQRYVLLPTVIRDLQSKLDSDGYKINYKNYSYSIALWEYDCENNSLRVIQGVDYDVDGVSVNRFKVEHSMDAAIPDSSSEKTLIFVCSLP